MRRIGVLLPLAENHPEAKADLSAFTQELKRLGWSEDRNIHIDIRFAAGTADRYPLLAKELAALQPDVLLSTSGRYSASYVTRMSARESRRSAGRKSAT